MNTWGHNPQVTSSLTRGCVYRLQLLLALASAVILMSKSRGIHDQILLFQIRDSSNLEGQVPVFISPRSRVARLYPQEMGSLSVAFYDSRDYSGGIRTRLHTDYSLLKTEFLLYKDSIRTSQETQYVTATKPNWLMLLRERFCVDRMQSFRGLKRVVYILTTGL
jgi:hypothetical protein